MGIPNLGADDASGNYVAGTLSTAGAAVATFRPAGAYHKFNAAVWGTFVGTVTIDRSFDGGATWINLSRDTSGTNNGFSAPFTLVFEEPEAGILYRFNCTAYTSGTINWRFSQ